MRWILACTLVCIFASCSKKNNIPPDILPGDKMEKVLWDMLLADRFSAQYLVKDSASRNIKKETLVLYQQVFTVNRITKEQFIKSYNFYLSRPDITKIIFDSLAVRANRRKEELYKKER